MPIAGLLLSILASYFIGVLGRNRKIGFWGHFFASLLLTPLIGLLLVVITDPVRDKVDREASDKKPVFKRPGEQDIIQADTDQNSAK
jgi:hypothetical protein